MKTEFKTLQLCTDAAKIRGCACTYLPLETCEGNRCPFARGGGCYAEWSRVHFHVQRVAARLAGLDPWAIEASEIRQAPRDYLGAVRGTPLRLRVAGNSHDETDAAETDAACGEWTEAGGGPPWGYDHAWWKIPAATWQHAAMLASVETPAGALAARAAGYRAALVALDARGAIARLKAVGLRAKWCKGEAKGELCQSCKWCWNSGPDLPVIVFTVHGSACGLRRARATIARLNEVML